MNQVAVQDNEHMRRSPISGQQWDLEQVAASRSFVEECLEEGNRLVQARQFEEALDYFSSALDLEPLNRAATVGANRATCALIPRWHFAMLNDLGRNQAFAAAIREAIDPDSLVLDIGSGTGLLAMLAAQHGGTQIVSCEANRLIARMATQIVAHNGFDDRIRVLPKLSTDLIIGKDLPRPADLLVTEIVDCGLLGEGILPTIRHARTHLLREGSRMIPQAGRVFAALLESTSIYNLNHIETACGFDVGLFNRFSTLNYYPVRLNTWEHRLLTKPQLVFDFDFRYDPLLPRERPIDFVATQPGRCQGVVFWFELDLNDHLQITNHPHNHNTHWMQAVMCLPELIDVGESQIVSMTAAHDDSAIWFVPRAATPLIVSRKPSTTWEGCNDCYACASATATVHTGSGTVQAVPDAVRQQSDLR